MLERHEIETFLTLADELHFGRTAERLGVTTGRISHVIRKLERRIGAPLFERTSRVVRITPIGRQLADELAPLVEQMDAALRRAIEAGRGVTGQLRVAFLGEYLAPVLLKAVRLFSARHPDCEVDVREVQLATSRASLLDGSIDVLVASYPFDGMACGPALMVERRVLAVAATHPLARAESVSLEVLADHPLIQYPAMTSAAFKRDRTPEQTPAGRLIPKGPRGNTFSEMLSLVAMGRGVLPVGEQTEYYHPRPDIAYVPIHDAPPIERGPIWLEANTTTRVREFVRAATDATAAPPR
ncbi:LysR family transcriptional regulator [Micromonospora sp. NPDC049891]|uniref:LysR family transcriptional regulator n=1 Tax=Micromonospora sp. NPDC049891 TaxID=3155655 RepID=UPI0033DCBFAC